MPDFPKKPESEMVLALEKRIQELEVRFRELEHRSE